MFLGAVGRLPKPARIPSRARLASGDASYSLNFAALAADEYPLSQGGIWTNNTQGTGGNAAMNTQESMQVRLSADTTVRICCEKGVVVNYEDSFAFVPGFAGNQRVQSTIYRQSGYSPSSNHEMEQFLGAVVYGNNNKRAVEVLVSRAGSWVLVVHNGAMSGSTFTVLSSSTVTGAYPPEDGDLVRSELDRTNKTIKTWSKRGGDAWVLRCSTQWATTHDEIDATVQGYLNNLGDGAGLAGLRRADGPNDAIEGAFGWRDILISSTLLG